MLAHSAVDLIVDDPNTDMRAVRNAETNLGDFCADAFRIQMGADVGLMNGGGIRASIPTGDITYQETLSVFPLTKIRRVELFLMINRILFGWMEIIVYLTSWLLESHWI